MIVKIILVVSACANLTFMDAAKRAEELKHKNPGAIVTIRQDKKCLKDKLDALNVTHE